MSDGDGWSEPNYAADGGRDLRANILHEDYMLCHVCHGETATVDLAVELPPTCYDCWVDLQEHGGEG
jgi:hypothetical protein